MKKILLLPFMFGFSQMHAQEIKVKNGNEKFSSGNHECLKTTIYYANKDDVMSNWKSKMNDFRDEKVTKKGDEIFADNILIKDWGNNTVDIYSVFNEDKEKKSIELSVAVDLGGAYLNSSDKKKQEYIERMMKDFAIKMSKNAVEAELKVAEKALSKIEDEKKDLESQESKLKDNIEDYKKKISKAEDELKENSSKQDKKKSELEAQKKLTDEVKNKLNKIN